MGRQRLQVHVFTQFSSFIFSICSTIATKYAYKFLKGWVQRLQSYINFSRKWSIIIILFVYCIVCHQCPLCLLFPVNIDVVKPKDKSSWYMKIRKTIIKNIPNARWCKLHYLAHPLIICHQHPLCLSFLVKIMSLKFFTHDHVFVRYN